MKIDFVQIDYQKRVKDTLEDLEKTVPNTFATRKPEIVEVSKLEEAISKVRNEIDLMGKAAGSMTRERIIPINCRDSLINLIKNPSSGTLDLFVKMSRKDYGNKISNTFKEWFDGIITKEDS